MKTVTALLGVLLLTLMSSPAIANVTIQVESKQPVEATIATPMLKMRQGEPFKVFDGLAGGIKVSPWITRNTWAKHLNLSGLAMVSSSTQASDAQGNSQDQVFSLALVAGFQWFQIGIGRDMISTQEKDIFKEKDKWFVVLNLSANITW